MTGIVRKKCKNLSYLLKILGNFSIDIRQSRELFKLFIKIRNRLRIDVVSKLVFCYKILNGNKLEPDLSIFYSAAITFFSLI